MPARQSLDAQPEARAYFRERVVEGRVQAPLQ
jgi:hypothetical protein